MKSVRNQMADVVAKFMKIGEWSNGIVLPLESAEAAINTLLAEKRTVYGVNKFEKKINDGKVSVQEISHYVDNIRIENDYLVGDITVFENNEGWKLKRAIETSKKIDGLKFYFESSGLLERNKIVNLAIQMSNAVVETEEAERGLK